MESPAKNMGEFLSSPSPVVLPVGRWEVGSVTVVVRLTICLSADDGGESFREAAKLNCLFILHQRLVCFDPKFQTEIPDQAVE